MSAAERKQLQLNEPDDIDRADESLEQAETHEAGDSEPSDRPGRRRPVTPEAFDAKLRKAARQAIDDMDSKTVLKYASSYKVLRELLAIADKSRLDRLEKKAATKREEKRRRILEEGGLMPLSRTKLEGGD